jgi:hypothetical protein
VGAAGDAHSLYLTSPQRGEGKSRNSLNTLSKRYRVLDVERLARLLGVGGERAVESDPVAELLPAPGGEGRLVDLFVQLASRPSKPVSSLDFHGGETG